MKKVFNVYVKKVFTGKSLDVYVKKVFTGKPLGKCPPSGDARQSSAK